MLTNNLAMRFSPASSSASASSSSDRSLYFCGLFLAQLCEDGAHPGGLHVAVDHVKMAFGVEMGEGPTFRNEIGLQGLDLGREQSVQEVGVCQIDGFAEQITGGLPPASV